MPTYQYACTDCGHEFEAVQSFSDDSLTTCPQCSGRLRKLFGNVGVVFKGSGFYRNDSRSSGTSDSTKSDGTKSNTSTKADSAKSDATKSDATKSGSSKSDASTSSSPKAAPAATSSSA